MLHRGRWKIPVDGFTYRDPPPPPLKPNYAQICFDLTQLKKWITKEPFQFSSAEAGQLNRLTEAANLLYLYLFQMVLDTTRNTAFPNATHGIW